MIELTSWRTAADCPGQDNPVLAIDFAMTGRPEADFATLMKLAETGLPLWQSLPPAPGEELSMNGPDYLDRWAAELKAAGTRVTAVLGNCASSPFALALRERVGGWQDRPPAVLFDPTAVTPSVVLRDGFYPALTSLAPVLGQERAERARQAARAAAEECAGLPGFVGRLADVYAAASHDACAAIGLPRERAEELLAWFRSYLNYLVAASEIELPDDTGGVTVIRASDVPPSLVSGLPELCVDVAHVDLLGDRGVARAVAGLLLPR